MKLADLTSHHIEGFALHGDTPFKVPLFSHIQGNLWMGGCPVKVAPNEFEYIVNLVSLYPWWEPYAIAKFQVHTRVHLNDELEIPSEDRLYALARCVNAYRRYGPTLVHCQAGLNRSGLVAALALIEEGMKAVDAITLLRNKRSPSVLCNRVFEEWLLTRDK
ncbi:MAG: dual specificity protein phosphatase family protein [Nitrosomonadaceae bacterium]